MAGGTFLEFVPGEGWVHKLHPVAKGMATFVAILLFSLHGFGLKGNLTGLTILLLGMFVSELPVRRIIAALKSLWFLLVLVVVVQSCSGAPHAFLSALDSLARMVGIFLCSAVFVTISSPSELTIFWEACFRPLRIVRFPVREAALVMVVAVRFLPAILDEVERIRLAQMARGARFGKNEGVWQSAKRVMPLLIPTLVLSIQRAEILAVAMEARCYRLDRPHTRYLDHKYGLNEAILFLFLAVLAAVSFSHGWFEKTNRF
ncbi:MAG: energy-coupling factor transporter transmembrane protein EcfT [Candidatus Riflebacteria bacterium]|nr:energy-coupling factor transporter transmembrane protein EcfT [Candidatus Riflebacteria bacterium]